MASNTFMQGNRLVMATCLNYRVGVQQLDFPADKPVRDAVRENLKIEKADFFGFRNDGTTTLQIALRHPATVKKIILGFPLSKRDGVPAQFWALCGKPASTTCRKS